jgi:hypothetical protein
VSGEDEGGRPAGEQLASREVFRGKTIRLNVDRVRLPNGREMDFEIVHHPGAAAVVPVLAGGEVLLVRQYRYATGGWLLEVPAGTSRIRRPAPGGRSRRRSASGRAR